MRSYKVTACVKGKIYENVIRATDADEALRIVELIFPEASWVGASLPLEA